MSIVITTTTQTIAGPTVAIHCPHCESKSVSAESFEQVDHLGLFYVIPLFRHHNTFLKCTSCGKQSIVKLSIDELEGLSSDDISQFLVGRVPLISKFLALASVALCWAPVVGLVLGVFGILANLKTIGWPKTVSWIGTALSAVVTIAFFVILALD